MKISRQDPVRRRRSPLSTLLVIAIVVLIGLLAVAWFRGGGQTPRQIEIAIPAEKLGH